MTLISTREARARAGFSTAQGFRRWAEKIDLPLFRIKGRRGLFVDDEELDEVLRPIERRKENAGPQ